jgi:hypothetical protein
MLGMLRGAEFFAFLVLVIEVKVIISDVGTPMRWIPLFAIVV